MKKYFVLITFIISNISIYGQWDNSYQNEATQEDKEQQFILENTYEKEIRTIYTTTGEPIQLTLYYKEELNNLPFLALGVLSFVYSYDCLDRLSDTNDMIESFKKLKLETNSLESDKSKYTILSIIGIGAGLYFTYYSLTPVKVYFTGNTVQLQVNL